MTKKLYWEDGTLSSFNSNILSVESYEKDPSKYVVVLGETAFYPEGGGQPSDEGTIDGKTVEYVYEEEGTIYHVMDIAPPLQQNVECKINWQRRFDFMQQHLGQHILSAVFEKNLSADTIGFHLGNEFVTIDITKDTLSYDEVKEIEMEANSIIYKNLNVYSHFPSTEELKKFPLRKAPSVSEGIRIVEIADFDYSPCGGTHPSNTGSVGIIKVRKWEKMKGQVRVEFVCGFRALKDFAWKNQQINEMSNLLSIKDVETQTFVERLVDENKILHKTVRNYKKELLDYQIKELHQSGELYNGCNLVTKIFEQEDFKNLQFMATNLSQFPKTIALLAIKGEKSQLIFTRSKDIEVNINKLFKEVIDMIDGKGGGNPQTAQGGGSNTSNLEGLMMAAVMKLKNEYLK